MRLTVAAVLSAALLVPLGIFGGTGFAQSSSPAASQYKITICHHTHSRKHPTVTIRISIRAWPAHQRHGDTMGACPGTAGHAKHVAHAAHVAKHHGSQHQQHAAKGKGEHGHSSSGNAGQTHGQSQTGTAGTTDGHAQSNGTAATNGQSQSGGHGQSGDDHGKGHGK